MPIFKVKDEVKDEYGFLDISPGYSLADRARFLRNLPPSQPSSQVAPKPIIRKETTYQLLRRHIIACGSRLKGSVLATSTCMIVYLF